MKPPPQPLTAHQQQLISSHWRLAHKHAVKALPDDNLRSEAVTAALIQTARRFDPDRGFKFSALLRSTLRFAIINAKRRAAKQKQHIPFDVEVLELIDPSEDDFEFIDRRLDLISTIERFRPEFKPHVFEMLRLRHGLDGLAPRLLREIADQFGITRSGVSEHLSKAEQKLRLLVQNSQALRSVE